MEKIAWTMFSHEWVDIHEDMSREFEREKGYWMECASLALTTLKEEADAAGEKEASLFIERILEAG